MSTSSAISCAIPGLRSGQNDAAAVIWDHYYSKLVRFARQKLDGVQRRAADEEDVALSAIHSLCRGFQAGRFDKIDNRTDLWKMLVTIAARKACKQRRQDFAAKRGAGQVRGESVFLKHQSDDPIAAGIGGAVGDELTPEILQIVEESRQQMLDCLGDETLKKIALWTLEGYSTTEIAGKMDCVRRTVERKLERIRKKWSQEAWL
jgi:DNA-directed RNA polymerase specialized sigma24 family protein